MSNDLNALIRKNKIFIYIEKRKKEKGYVSYIDLF